MITMKLIWNNILTFILNDIPYYILDGSSQGREQCLTGSFNRETPTGLCAVHFAVFAD